MCGRLTLIADIHEIKQHFMITHGSAVVVPRYNIAPGQVLLVVKDNKIEFLNWGFKLPNHNSGYIINAKIETILEKKLFNLPFKKQRCLVVASGFFEWKTSNNKKIPYYFQIKDQKILGFAGIVINHNCVILTTAADPTKYPLDFHNRVPVIIKKDQYPLWLESKTPIVQLIEPKIQIDQKDLITYPVSSQVNHVKFDNVTCIKSLIY